jgi:DNA-binding NarL/FixJ family response regulator
MIPVVEIWRANKNSIGAHLVTSRRASKPACVLATHPPRQKIRVFVAAENRLLREALTRVLLRQGNLEAAGMSPAVPLSADALATADAQILLLTSRGSLSEDLTAIHEARVAAPHVKILLIATSSEAQEFLQYVRAGIRGYLPRDASAQQVRDAVQAVHAGEALCPGSLCSALFHYLEQETSAPPCGSAHQVPRLTRREHELMPLIAQGLTNKEIASHFSLSETTVKNHLHRIKRKIGAEGRRHIVQLYLQRDFSL